MPANRFLPYIAAGLLIWQAGCTPNQPAGESTSERGRPAVATDTPPTTPGTARPEAGDTTSSTFTGTAGIVEKEAQSDSIAILREVRTARHDAFDRVVFEFEGNTLPGYHVEYIDKPVRACGSGEVVPLAGDGWLEVRMIPARAHTEEGAPTVTQRERRLDYPVLRELKATCDFEADVTWVLGVASPNRYRVLELANPSRLVIDVRH